MSTSPLDTYQSDAVERPLFRKRLILALIASLLLHCGLLLWFHSTGLPQFNAGAGERLVPRIFNVKTIQVDQTLLDGEDKDSPHPQQAKPNPAPKPLDVPDDKPVADVTQTNAATPTTPAPAELVKPILNEKPKVSADQTQAMAKVEDSAAKAMEQDLNSLKDQLLKEPPGAPKSLIKLPDGSRADAAGRDAAAMAAASGRLDKLITGGLHPGDAPVTMPGGALFGFDSATLLPAAIEQLRKLGMLIKKSPGVTFTIGGYTDSFGDADYNQQLSQQRAESVRTWLVENMDVDPSHIRAVGYGSTRFVAVPKPVDMHSQSSIEQEKLHEQANRRVEIKFRFPESQ